MKNFRQLPRLAKTMNQPTQNALPFISVIVPTRNEAFRVEPCIKSLKAQTYPNLEILIIDDSTDMTPHIISDIIQNDTRFRIIKQEPLPSGWIGKPHALHQGSKQAKGDWLLFIDADTSHDPQLITQAINYALKNSIDLLSLVPHHRCESFWEKVVQPIPLGLIPAIAPLAKVNKPNSKVVVAFGPFMLIRRTVYDKVGGYETIKGRIADDAEMAKLIKQSEYRVGLANAQELMSIRMYQKFADIWEGWSKNIFLGLVQKRGIARKGSRLLVAIIGALGIFWLMVLPFLSTLITLVVSVLFSSAWQGLFFFSLFLFLLSIVIQGCIQYYYRIGDPKFAFLSFLGGLVTIGIFLNSAIKSLSGSGVAWKGRIYAENK